MNPTAIYSKSGKGVQEASGKTSLLKRPDRAVLSAIDGRATLAEVAQKVGRTFDSSFEQLIVQLDKDGFVREVSAGTASAARPAASAKPGAKAPAKPAATGPMDAASDLDFSSLGAAKPAASPPLAARPAPAAPKPAPAAPKPAPAAPKPSAAAEAHAKEQLSALNKAREEAEAKAQAERERIKAETEAKMRAELEAKARADAEDKIKAESRAKDDTEAKVKAAREAAVRAAAEAKAKADAERKAREETERRLEQERKAREETERRLEQERKAREEAERKAREEAERARKQLEEERRKLEEERKREEQERAARRKREEEEEQARKKKREEEEQRAEAERAARRKQREEEEERQAEEERAARRKQREQEKAREGEEAPAEAQEKPKVEAKPQPKAAGGLDSLLADLDSFTQRDEDERKASDETARKAKAEAERRAREDAERREREESERKAKDAQRSQKDDEKRRRKEEEERLAREQEKEQARVRDEEERRKREADERARKAKEEEILARQASAGPAAPVGESTDHVRRRMAGKRGEPKTEHYEAPARPRRPSSGWGKPVAVTLVVLLAAAIGVAHVMPISTGDYERAASEALGRPVKIGSTRLSLITGLELHFKDVKIGDGVTIASVVGSPEFGALRGEKKVFSRINLEGVKFPQEALGETLFARVKGDNFAVGRIVVKQLELDGPVPLPKPLEADLAFGSDGALRSATLRGPDTLLAKLTPKDASIEFEMTASGFPLPVVPGVTLSDFAMKGTASRRGMSISEWGGKLLGGVISGTANVRWGRTWNVEGLITARSINAAVFAPALLSEGKAEGSGKFSMNGAEPSKLATAGRIEGSFTVSMGVLGSFDLARAIQTNGKAVNGRTQFSEMNGQGVYDHGAVALRNVTIGAGRLNAGASADIAQGGALSGRIVADMKTASQTLRATLNLGGTVREPQVRN